MRFAIGVVEEAAAVRIGGKPVGDRLRVIKIAHRHGFVPAASELAAVGGAFKAVELQLIQRQRGTGGAHGVGVGIGEEADDGDEGRHGGHQAFCPGKFKVARRARVENEAKRVRPRRHCRLHVFKAGQAADFDAHPHGSVPEFAADIRPAVAVKGFVVVKLREVRQGFRRVCREAAVVPPAAVAFVAAGF